MHPLYTEAEFKAAKSRDKLPLKCLYCDESFLCQKNFIQRVTTGNSHHRYDYCSLRCARFHTQPANTTICAQCGHEVKKPKSQLKKSKSGKSFCSRPCAGKWNSAHKKHGTRRSKLEVWLEAQLTSFYPDLEIHFNRKDAILSELDIFIPSLLLAFELNGIFHYEPIYGQNKLDSIQSNDRRKFAACHETGIELCIIDNSSLKYFKEQRAMKFLTIIQDIINTRLSGS